MIDSCNKIELIYDKPKVQIRNIIDSVVIGLKKADDICDDLSAVDIFDTSFGRVFIERT